MRDLLSGAAPFSASSEHDLQPGRGLKALVGVIFAVISVRTRRTPQTFKLFLQLRRSRHTLLGCPHRASLLFGQRKQITGSNERGPCFPRIVVELVQGRYLLS